MKKIIGNTADAPYINAIAKACSYSKNDLSLSTTSLANYIALTSGHTGCDKADANGLCTHELPITANKPPELLAAGLDEHLRTDEHRGAGQRGGVGGGQCGQLLYRCAGLFTVTHTPFPVLHADPEDAVSAVRQAVPREQRGRAVGEVQPRDPEQAGHHAPGAQQPISQRIQNGDNWLKGYLPGLLNSATYQAGRSAIIITWDEGNGSTYTVPLIVITPYTTAGWRLLGSRRPLLGAQGHGTDGRSDPSSWATPATRASPPSATTRSSV